MGFGMKYRKEWLHVKKVLDHHHLEFYIFVCVVNVVYKSFHVFVLGYEDAFKNGLFLRSKKIKNNW